MVERNDFYYVLFAGETYAQARRKSKVLIDLIENMKMPELLQRLLGYNRVNQLCGGVDCLDLLHYFNDHKS